MLNIVLPIAGRGSRFSAVGYLQPKPLIPVHGEPMIEVVVNNLRPACAHRFIFLSLREHLEHWSMATILRRAAPDCEIVPVDAVTEGAACTVLLAEALIDTEESLMIANTDQYIAADVDGYIERSAQDDCDGLIMTFTAKDPKWSYVRKNDQDLVIDVVEKKVVSDEATVGIYNFRHGSDFVRSAKSMIRRNLRVNGEFYVAPAYNPLIEAGARIRTYGIPPEGIGMFGLGTPEDLELFLQRSPAVSR